MYYNNIDWNNDDIIEGHRGSLCDTAPSVAAAGIDINNLPKHLFDMNNESDVQCVARNGAYTIPRRIPIYSDLNKLGIYQVIEDAINVDKYTRIDGSIVPSPVAKDENGLYYIRDQQEFDRRMDAWDKQLRASAQYKFKHERQWVHNRLFFDKYD